MRSEERAGIVSVILLFLWGTLLTEPLHAFMRVFTSIIDFVLSLFGKNIYGKVGGAFLLVSLLVFVLGSLFLSRTSFNVYIPCTYFSIASLVYLVFCIKESEYDFKTVVALSSALLVIAILHAFKFERGLIWASDVCIYTPAMFLIVGMVFIPLRLLIGKFGRVFYITRKQSLNLALPFDGFLHLPQLVWGVFIAIIFVLPIIYFSFSRTSKN